MRSIVTYAVLVGPWLHLDRVYAYAYRFAIDRYIQILPLDRRVWLSECRAPDPKVNTCVRYVDEASGEIRTRVHRGQQSTYPAAALLLAFALATPIRWSHRLRALLVAALLFGGYLVLKQGAHFCLEFAGDPLSWLPVPLGERKWLLFVLAYPPWYVAPVLIWVAVISCIIYLESVVAPGSPDLHPPATSAPDSREDPDRVDRASTPRHSDETLHPTGPRAPGAAR